MSQSTGDSIYWRNDIYAHWYIKDVLCGIFVYHIARREHTIGNRYFSSVYNKIILRYNQINVDFTSHDTNMPIFNIYDTVDISPQIVKETAQQSNHNNNCIDDSEINI